MSKIVVVSNRGVFLNKDLQMVFDKDGFVVVPFLDQQEIDYLIRAYHGMDSDLNMGFHATMHSHLVDYRRQVTEIIGSVFNSKAARYLQSIDINEVAPDFYNRYIIGSKPEGLRKVGDLPVRYEFVKQEDINVLVS